jgi:hypothetical protein
MSPLQIDTRGRRGEQDGTALPEDLGTVNTVELRDRNLQMIYAKGGGGDADSCPDRLFGESPGTAVSQGFSSDLFPAATLLQNFFHPVRLLNHLVQECLDIIQLRRPPHPLKIQGQGGHLLCGDKPGRALDGVGIGG